jgi:hypothetical protein
MEGRLPRWERVLRLASIAVMVASVLIVAAGEPWHDVDASRPGPSPAVLVAERTSFEVSGSIPGPTDHLPACAAGQLVVRSTASTLDASESTTTVTFGSSGETCTIYGRPQLRLSGPDGTAVPVQINRGARPPERVVVAPASQPLDERVALVTFAFDVDHSDLWLATSRPAASMQVRLPGIDEPFTIAVPGYDSGHPVRVPAAVEVPAVAS